MMSIFKRKKKKRVCVVGLDGVPISLIQQLSSEGIMPATAKILESGYLHQMTVSLPEISAVSWTNFMTGTNSGTHGIFGFVDLVSNSYNLRFPNFGDVKSPTIWDRLAEKDKKSIVINQPFTYPAQKINGVLISGFVAIYLEKAIYPLSIKEKLKKFGYQIDIDTAKSREDHNFLWQELEKTLASRQKAVDYFWEKEDWDYFQVVITGTDRLHHFLWPALKEKNHLYHNHFLDYYHKIDQFIEKIYYFFNKISGWEEPGEGFFILSDHGFTQINQEVYLNAWLEKEGYLKFRASSPETIADISSESVAFALDPNRIYLNLKGKFPNGWIKESESETIKKELREKLSQIEYNGQKIVRRIFDKEEIYSGPYLNFGPDLVVLSFPGFDMKGSVRKKEIFGRTNLEGMHTWDDAFFFSPIKVEKELNITDLAEIIMKSFSFSN
ncbi:MAG: alkaline phosphatase family protein [Candidatus Aminicenantia bacterium]